jgi:hypothetical protein
MNGRILGFLTAALMTGGALTVSPAAFSSSVTYNYTGFITYFYNAGASTAIGSQVSGTYTFDFANGNPAQSSGIIGSANWTVAAGGSPPTPTLLVFSSTAQVGGFSYNTPVPPTGGFDPYSQSSVQGSANSGGRGSTFTASEAWGYTPDTEGGSSLSISNPHGAYSANGLPILAGATATATGEVSELVAGSGSEINFNITSLTRAPEIDSASAASGVTLLLSGLAMALGAHRSRSPEHRKRCAV